MIGPRFHPLPWLPDPKRGPGLFDANDRPVSFLREADWIEFMAARWGHAEQTIRAVAVLTAGCTAPSSLRTVHELAEFGVAVIDGAAPPVLQRPRDTQEQAAE